MLKVPPDRRGVSKSFQPRWSGPWIINKLIGITNCQLENESGTVKHVHCNQLKKTEKRNPIFNEEQGQGYQNPRESKISLTEQVDPSIFEPLSFPCQLGVSDDSSDESEENRPSFPIDNAYVDIDENNIIENRLRNAR